MYTIFGILLIFVAIIYLVVKRGLEMKMLANQGENITGKITKKYKTKGKVRNRYLKYEYSTPTGKTYSRSSLVADSIWDQYNESDSIELIYLPNKPQVCGPKYMVDLAKQALATPK